MITSRLLLLVSLTALAVAACSSEPDLARVDETLDAQAQAQQALLERVEELEGQVETVTDDSGEQQTQDALGELRDRVESVQAGLGDLGTRIDEEATAREQGDADAETGLSDVRGGLNGVRDQVSQLEAQLAQLDAAVDALQARLDRHQQQSGH